MDALETPADQPLADDLQARLLIMEQSLVAMARYLRRLEQDLAESLGLQPPPKRKHARAAAKPPAAPVAVAILSPDHTPFETIVKAMQKLAGS